MDFISSAVSAALGAPESIWVALIIFAALFIRAAIGFGDGLIGVPLLAFFMDISEAVPLMLFVASTMSFIALWKDRQQIHLRSLGRTTVAALIGFPLGIVFLKYTDAASIKGILGSVLITLAIWQLKFSSQARLKGSAWSYLFGLLAGVLGAAYAMRGVVFAIYGNLRGWSPGQFKGTIHGFYILTGLMIPFVYFGGGLVTQRVIGLYFLILPLATVATIAGSSVTGKLNAEHFQTIIWWCLLILGGFFVLHFVANHMPGT